MRHQFDVELEKFGTLTYMETLCFYDRDLAMSYKDESDNLYYAYLQSIREPIDRWILIPVSPETLGRIDRQELYMKDWAELLNRDETEVYSFEDPKHGITSPVVKWSREKKSEYAASLLEPKKGWE